MQQGQTHCQQCGKKWPAPAPAKQQPRNPQKPPKAPSPAPQRNTEQRDKREEERRLKRAVTTIWDQIPEEARSHLTQAGWRGPPRAKEANDQATDPLLSLLVQRKDELPEDVRAAVVEAERLAEYRARAKKRQRPPAVETPPGLPSFQLGSGEAPPTAPLGANPLNTAQTGNAGNPKSPEAGGRHRSRTPPKSGDGQANEEERKKQAPE